MSSWEENIRAEVLASKRYAPQPNWDKMAGMLDRAERSRRRRWLIAAAIGSLLAISASLWSLQPELSRAPQLATRSVSPPPALSPAQTDSEPVSTRPDKAAASPLPLGIGELSLANHSLPQPGVPFPAALMGTALHQEPIRPVGQGFALMPMVQPPASATAVASPDADFAVAAPVAAPLMPTPAQGQPIRWELGLRGQTLINGSRRFETAAGDQVIETGYGPQPGAWVEVAALLPSGWEFGVAAGTHAVWQPLPGLNAEPNTFTDLWGQAVAGVVQARRYLHPTADGRLQPFISSQLGYARQQVTMNQFQLPEQADMSSFWKSRRSLPESAVITTEGGSRNLLLASLGAGLKLHLSERLAMYLSSHAQWQEPLHEGRLALASPELSAGQLSWDHQLGLRVAL